MTDPSDALQDFQRAVLDGEIQVERLGRGVLDRNLFIHLDRPNGGFRVTYVRLEGRTVTAFVEFSPCEPIEGTWCFSIGYAVPEAYRNQGRAKEVVRAAIAEMQHDARQYGRSVFYVEAIVGADNKYSQRVAEQVISNTPEDIRDELSGLPALRYVRKIEAA